MIVRVRVLGWIPSANPKPVSLSDLLRQHTGLTLTEAKRQIDKLAEDGAIVVELADEREAAAFEKAAADIGALTARIALV
jgi:ribosomal protein L7/L12